MHVYELGGPSNPDSTAKYQQDLDVKVVSQTTPVEWRRPHRVSSSSLTFPVFPISERGHRPLLSTVSLEGDPGSRPCGRSPERFPTTLKPPFVGFSLDVLENTVESSRCRSEGGMGFSFRPCFRVDSNSPPLFLRWRTTPTTVPRPSC